MLIYRGTDARTDAHTENINSIFRDKLLLLGEHVYKLVEEIYTDQTGAFPVTSQRGYRYIMVSIHIDADYIFCKLMKNRKEGEMITAYQKMVDRMEIAGLGLKHHRLDNKCSENFEKCIK
jgi:hypothetical protein